MAKTIKERLELLGHNTSLVKVLKNTDEDVNLEGDGWRVISEERFNQERNTKNNPFANLDELLNTKEDR